MFRPVKSAWPCCFVVSFAEDNCGAPQKAGAGLVDTSRALGGADNSHKPHGVTARGSAQNEFDGAAD